MASLDIAVSVWKCRRSLIDQLLVDDISPYLRQEDILDQDGEEIIKHNEITSTGQADKLIEIILNKCVHDDDEKAAILFTEALNQCQKHLCHLIQDTVVSPQDTERYLIEGFQKRDISAEPKQNLFIKTSEFLERQLRETYSHDFSYLHPIPWNPDVRLGMNEMFSECTFIDITQQPNQQSSVGVTLGNQSSRPQEQTIDHLFDGTEACPEPRRITVEGPMGVGKTTMLHKLAYDWACNRNDITKRFEYVFYFSRHTLKGTLPQSIIETILPEDANSEHLPLKMMLLLSNQEIQQKTLILVDGFDESEDGLFHDIWIVKKLRYCTVVQTSQSGLNRGDLSKATQKHCLYLGLSMDGRKSYVERYVSVMGISVELLKSLDILPFFLCDLLNIPLFLSFICLLLEEKMSVSRMNHFHLLDEVVNLTWMRSAKNPEISLVEVKKEITPFYETAYKSILNPGVLKRPTSSLLSSFGFLIEKKTKSKLNPNVSTHFTHQLFQEYFAMKYLVSLAPDDMFRELEKLPLFHKTSLYVLMAGYLSTQNPSLPFQFYKLISDIKEHIKFKQDQWDFNWILYPRHNPGHIILQCLNQTGVVEGIGPALSEVFPRCFVYNPACKMCFKGLLLAADAYELTSDVVINSMLFNDSIHELNRSEPCKGISGVLLLTGCGKSINKLLIFLILTKFPDLQHLTINVFLMVSFSEISMAGLNMLSDDIDKRELNLINLYLLVTPFTTVKFQPNVYESCQKFFIYIMNISSCKLNALSLNGLFIDSRTSGTIQQCLNKSPTIKAFSMSDTSGRGINNILKALLICKELRCFEMYGNRIADTALPSTAYKILRKPSLREVRLSFHSISGLRLKMQSKHLSSLSLDNITWTDGVPTHLLEILESSQMKSFSLTNIVKNDVLASIFHDHITHLKNVTRLNLSFNQIGSSIVFQEICCHLASLQSLSELKMVQCGITDETFHHMQRLMDHGQLTTLWLAGNTLRLKNILKIIEKLKLLKELSITVTKAELQSMSKLYEFLATSRTFIRLVLCVVAKNNEDIALPKLPFNVELFVIKPKQAFIMLDSTLGYKFMREWMYKY